jgi:hypothetical protein
MSVMHLFHFQPLEIKKYISPQPFIFPQNISEQSIQVQKHTKE